MRTQFRVTCNRCDEDIVFFNWDDLTKDAIVEMRRHQQDCKGIQV